MKANEFIPVPEAMDGNQDFENKMAKIGRVIMDMGMKMNKDDAALEKGTKFGKLGDALTTIGNPGGPKSMGDLVKISGLSPKEIKQAMAVGQEMPDPVNKMRDKNPTPDIDGDDEFGSEPSDAEIDRMATDFARG